MHRITSPIALLVVVLLFLPGCIKVKQKLTLNKDLSGQVELQYTMDFKSVAKATVQIQREMTGDETPVTDAEIDAAMAGLKAEMEGDLKGEDGAEPERPFPELENLPEGIKILKEELRIEPEQLVGQVVLSFDHVSRLTELRTQLDGQDGEDKQLAGVLGTFEVEQKGRLVTVTGVPFESMHDPMMDAETRDMVTSLVKDMEFVFELVTPMKVKMSDADKKKGKLWTWGVEEMLAEAAPSFKAVLRK